MAATNTSYVHNKGHNLQPQKCSIYLSKENNDRAHKMKKRHRDCRVRAVFSSFSVESVFHFGKVCLFQLKRILHCKYSWTSILISNILQILGSIEQNRISPVIHRRNAISPFQEVPD